MKKSFQAGDGNLNGIIILAVIIVIIIIMPKESREGGATVTSRANFPAYESGKSVSAIRNAQESQHISLGTGNAAYVYQPYEEYITIENYGSGPVNVSGWQLKNGKDQRPYYQGGALQRFSADVAVLPQVVLGRGERAIVTTGSVGVQSPYKIANFKENICTGYIERHPDYAFTPPLTQNCPRPDEEPGVKDLDVECRRFLSTLSSCETPEFNTRDSEGNICTNCVNGRPLSGACVAFVKEHFNYGSCIAYHQNDPDFEGDTWRVFLGRGWEMWAEEYETIELFNNLGQLVDFQNY